MVDEFVDGLGAGTHDDDHAFGFGVADIVEERVGATRLLLELLHGVDDVLGAGVVEPVDGFTSLEKGVGVLRGAANHRVVGRQRPLAVGADQFIVDEGPQIVVLEEFDLGDLVRGPEAVEEMEKRMIMSTLERNDGNLTRAADHLGITRQTMHNKLKKYGL